MALLDILIGPISSILEKVIPDKNAREKMAHEIATMSVRQAHEIAVAQIDVNKQEAAHQNLFVAGWRPAVGWICALGMASNFLLLPAANFVLALTQTMTAEGVLIQLPLVDLDTMLPVLMGMLGLGALRSYEKVKGVAREK